ncbi:MAG: gamma-glutamyltransferase family protein [Armatimonadetes bacterium]|nr:gamma-glutamyltransferase family protein [Armatimonadota bacterium]
MRKTGRPFVGGRHYAVSSGHALASMVGARMLERGGNAVDAGVAAGIALNVLQPDFVTFGGVAPIIIYLAARREVVTISGVGWWPKAASIAYFREKAGGEIPPGVLRSLVPAAPDAWMTALQHFGTLTLAEVLAPSIELADRGFPTHNFQSTNLARWRDGFERWPSTRAVFLPHGRPPAPGEPFVAKDLARTRVRLVEGVVLHRGEGREGAIQAARDRFYRGDIAKTLVEFARDQGGVLDRDDLAEFAVTLDPPVSVEYRGVRVYGCGPWCQGPALLQALAILERFDLARVGHNTTDHLHLMAEALKLAFADRERYCGDPRFVDVPLDRLLSKEHAARCAEMIRMDRAWEGLPPVRPPVGRRAPAAAGGGSGPVEGGAAGDGSSMDTSYACAVDEAGNIFSATPSDTTYDTPLVPGLGFGISPRGMQSMLLDDHPNSLQPRKRPRLTPNPALAFRDGEPCLAIGTPGGDVQPQAMAQVMCNVVDFDMGPQEAVEAPRVATSAFPSTTWPQKYDPAGLKVEVGVEEEVRAALAARGHAIAVSAPADAWRMGGVCLIIRDPRTGLLLAGADPRRECYAVAW